MATSNENQAAAPDNLDEIDKETLISLLRDKAKALNQHSTKLNRLEEKYVKIFKENKNYAKDKEAIEKIIRTVFPAEEADKFLPYDIGFLDGTKIAETFQSKKEQAEQEKAILVKELVTAREETEKRNQELSAKLEEAEKKIVAQENEINSCKACLEEQDVVIKGFTLEIAELNGIINNKNQEMMKYKKLEDEIASLKAESLIKELKSKNQNDSADLRTKFEQSNRTDQILKLKNELEEAHEQISRLEKEKAELNATVAKLGGGSHDRKKGGNSGKRDFEMQVNFDLDGHVNGNTKDHSPSHFEASIQQAMGQAADVQTPRRTSLEVKENGEFIPKDQHILNQQYLKNVVLKYFIYAVGENEREANLLMSAICTILKMSKEERTMIENARKTSLWGKTKNLIYDKVVGAPSS